VYDPDPAGARVEAREDGGASGGELTSRDRANAYQRRRNHLLWGSRGYLLLTASVHSMADPDILNCGNVVDGASHVRVVCCTVLDHQPLSRRKESKCKRR
jgi:hypothetical protein